VDASYITGIGALKQAEVDRMLILVDIEQLMTSADMGLLRANLH
jgi:purine-binding chemotaxis protein CheW